MIRATRTRYVRLRGRATLCSVSRLTSVRSDIPSNFAARVWFPPVASIASRIRVISSSRTSSASGRNCGGSLGTVAIGGARVAHDALLRKGNDLDLAVFLQLLARDHYVAPFQFAIVYAALGDKARALDLLEQDRREHSMFVTWLKTDPALDVLRPDARFRTLVAAVPLFGARQ